ncbi:S-adenosyl-L-methionine-dependent methyltransferase [Endogone sp. FLAS-F59071]|nr:S-adenosyl-L-methionine-dependent methyltransferase [Endogone sp. FLAS-F59071]|eukprot:RUS15131.1 S-adenosyl-L-methionine-dependent methyltransferase [Endogone sp. FLAS-F59071]
MSIEFGGTCTESSKSILPEGFKLIDDQRKPASKYVLPQTEDEMQRLDVQHYIMRHHLHGNFSAPVEEALEQGIKVLDVGCGTGAWMLEMAADYPRSTFVGIDIANVFPISNVPANCTFFNANVLKGLPFEEEFDYVFQRFLLLAFTPEEWATSVKEIVRVTKPGGWIELFEQSVKLERPPQCMDVWNAAQTICWSRGIDTEYVWHIKELLASNNIEDIEMDYISCPLGWGGRVGEVHAENILLVYVSMAPMLRPIMGVDEEEYALLSRRYVRGCAENRSWFKCPYAFGRKPLKC